MVSVEGSMNESSKATEAASYATTASEAWTWDASQLAELNRHLDKPFGEVERFNQALAFVLWKSGHSFQWRSPEGSDWWPIAHYMIFDDGAHYRILPKAEVHELTPWFPASVWPVHEGIYEVYRPCFEGEGDVPPYHRLKWEGERWFYCEPVGICGDGDWAAMSAPAGDQWRGILKEPK